MKKEKRITVYDIAEELGISVSTVSRVLNNSTLVTGEKRKLILETAERLGYRKRSVKRPRQRVVLNILVFLPFHEERRLHLFYDAAELFLGIREGFEESRVNLITEINRTHIPLFDNKKLGDIDGADDSAQPRILSPFCRIASDHPAQEEPAEPADDRDRHHGSHQQQDAQCRREAPVKLLHLILDQVGEHDVAAPADQGRRDEEAHGEHEDDQEPGDGAVERERQEDPPEGLEGPGAQHTGGAHQVAVDLGHGGIAGHDLDRQQDLQHGDVDRARGEEQACRALHQAQAQQCRVDDAVAPQQHHPGIGTDEDAHPQRNENEEDQQELQSARLQGDEVGDGIADQGGEQRHHQRDLQGPPEDPEIDRPIPDPLEVLGGKVRVPEARLDDVEAGQQEEGQQQHQGRHQQEAGLGLLQGQPCPCCSARSHRSSRVLSRGLLQEPLVPALLEAVPVLGPVELGGSVLGVGVGRVGGHLLHDLLGHPLEEVGRKAGVGQELQVLALQVRAHGPDLDVEVRLLDIGRALRDADVGDMQRAAVPDDLDRHAGFLQLVDPAVVGRGVEDLLIGEQLHRLRTGAPPDRNVLLDLVQLGEGAVHALLRREDLIELLLRHAVLLTISSKASSETGAIIFSSIFKLIVMFLL